MSSRRWVRWLKVLALAAWLGAHVWLWATLPPVPLWSASGTNIRDLKFTPDGQSLVTYDDDTISVWDVASGQRKHSWRWHDRLAGDFFDVADRRALAYDS